jgi:integration host factor subunit alpha
LSKYQDIEIIKSTLASGEDVMISNFGRFCVKEKKEWKGRNPATGDDLILDQGRLLRLGALAN